MAQVKDKFDIKNPANWKKTSKKNYEVYVCMPKLGTQVTNKLENAHYTTNENKRFVISGTVGETWVIDFNKLAKTYCFLDGSPITEQAIMSRHKVYHDNTKGSLNGQSSIPAGRQADKMKQAGYEVVVDWMHLKTLPGGGTLNYAFHLPINMVQNFPVQTSWGDVLYANAYGVAHGSGDFLVCSAGPNGPNLNDVWVVNGEVFPTTYDMRAFPGLASDKALEAKTPQPQSILAYYDKQRYQQKKEMASSNPALSNINKLKALLLQTVKPYGLRCNIHDEGEMIMLDVSGGKAGHKENKAVVGIAKDDATTAQIWFDKDDELEEQGSINLSSDSQSIKAGLDSIKQYLFGDSEINAQVLINAINSMRPRVNARLGSDYPSQQVIEFNKYDGNLFAELFINKDGLSYVLWKKNSDNPVKEQKVTLSLSNNASLQQFVNMVYEDIYGSPASASKNIKFGIENSQLSSDQKKKLFNKASNLAKLIDKYSNDKLSMEVNAIEEEYCNVTVYNKELHNKLMNGNYVEIFVSTDPTVSVSLFNRNDEVTAECEDVVVAGNGKNIKQFIVNCYNWAYRHENTFN